MIKHVSLLLFTTLFLSLQSPSLAEEKECVAARFIALFGTNTDESPYMDFKTPTECCEACRNYEEGEGCAAYTFFYGECQNECWLKTRVTFQYFKPSAVSGSYYVTSGDGTRKPKTSVLDVPGTVDTSVEALPAVFQGVVPAWLTKHLDEDCVLDDVNTNFMYKAGKSDPLPIFNLKCPEDCKKACYDHQEMSGRYSCVAYNFVYAKDVTECWLLTGTGIIKIPKPGYTCGTSNRTGHEMGPPPTKYREILELYRDLLKDSTKCVGTIEDLSALGL